jgi:hypothetical protein
LLAANGTRLRIAIKVAVERGDRIAEAHARAGLSTLLRRIKELKNEGAEKWVKPNSLSGARSFGESAFERT